MKKLLRRVDLATVLRQTQTNKRIVENYKTVIEDSSRSERREAHECVICFYGSRIGGAAMTESQCGICEKEMMFGSTATDNLCNECAIKNKLCKCCGSDLELKNRRKL